MAQQYPVSLLFKVIDKGKAPLKRIKKNLSGVTLSTLKASVAMKKMGDMSVIASNKMVASSAKMGAAFKKRMFSKTTGVALLAASGMMVKASMDFNKSMANVASLIPGNVDRVKELKMGVQDMAMGIGKTTDDLSAGLYEVVSAFGDNETTLDRLKMVAKSATAGVAGTSESLNLLSIITKEYGDTSAPAMEHASDLAFMAVKKGQTTFSELAGTMSEVVPIAAQLNVKQEELFAAYASFTRGPGSATRLSTQLNAAMMSFIKPTDSMKKAFKQMGYESGSAMMKNLGFAGSMEKILELTGGSKEKMAELFGQMRAVKLAMRMSGPGMKDYNSKLSDMENAAGSTDAAFKEQTEGINKTGHEWNKAMASMKVAMQSLGDAAAPATLKIAHFITTISKGIIQFDRATASLDKLAKSKLLSQKEKDVMGAFAIEGKSGAAHWKQLIWSRELRKKTDAANAKRRENNTGTILFGTPMFGMPFAGNTQLDITVKSENGTSASVRKTGGKSKVKVKNSTYNAPLYNTNPALIAP